MKEHYTPEEVDAIMRRAIEQAPLPGTMSRAQLEQLASEIGVSTDALAKAEADYVVQSRGESDQSIFQSFLAWRRSVFVRSMMVRAAVIAFLLGLGAVLEGNEPDGPFLIASLGVGLSMSISWAGYANAGGLEHSKEYAQWLDERSLVLRKVRYLKNPVLRGRDDDDD